MSTVLSTQALCQELRRFLSTSEYLYILTFHSPKTSFQSLKQSQLATDLPWTQDPGQLTSCKYCSIVYDSVYLIGSPDLHLCLPVCVCVCVFMSLASSQWGLFSPVFDAPCPVKTVQPSQDWPEVANPSLLSASRDQGVGVWGKEVPSQIKLPKNAHVSQATHYPGNFENVCLLSQPPHRQESQQAIPRWEPISAV